MRQAACQVFTHSFVGQNNWGVQKFREKLGIKFVAIFGARCGRSLGNSGHSGSSDALLTLGCFVRNSGKKNSCSLLIVLGKLKVGAPVYSPDMFCRVI